MEAELEFPSGATGHIRCSIWGWPLVAVSAKVVGSLGSIKMVNPVVPHMIYHHLKIDSPTITGTERFWGPSTYDFQLQRFVDGIQHSAQIVTNSTDAVLNMKVIDAIYVNAGMVPRGQ